MPLFVPDVGHAPIGDFDEGSFTITDGYLFQYHRLVVSGANRVAVEATGRFYVLEEETTGDLIVGQPKNMTVPFTVPDNWAYDVPNRLTMPYGMRVTLLGTADLIIDDNVTSRSRLVLAGRG